MGAIRRMRREIKFRAFSQRERRMIFGYPVILNGVFDCFVEDITGCRYGTEYWEVELMQYTEQRDNDKKFIYDLDIIQLYPDTRRPYNRVMIMYTSDGWRAFFSDGTFYKNLNEMLMSVPCKIIGNIFENKDLLTKEVTP